MPDFATVKRPENAPRSLPGTQTCAVVYRRAPCVPRSREHEKIPTGAGEKRETGLKPTRPMWNRQNLFFFIVSRMFDAVFDLQQKSSNARQPQYNSRASSISLCDSHERCFCVWVRERACVIVGSRNQEQSREQNQKRCHSALKALFHFCYAVCCRSCCVPATLSPR